MGGTERHFTTIAGTDRGGAEMRRNSPRYLLDTNILVYSIDEGEPAKRDRALGVLGRVGQPREDGPSGSLPAQALAEFSRVALNRLQPPILPDDVYHHVSLYERVFPVFALTPAVVLEAVRAVRDHGFAYYDAQIWAVAKLNQIPVVLSEDFAAGSTVEGVRFSNPFAPSFVLSDVE